MLQTSRILIHGGECRKQSLVWRSPSYSLSLSHATTPNKDVALCDPYLMMISNGSGDPSYVIPRSNTCTYLSTKSRITLISSWSLSVQSVPCTESIYAYTGRRCLHNSDHDVFLTENKNCQSNLPFAILSTLLLQSEMCLGQWRYSR